MIKLLARYSSQSIARWTLGMVLAASVPFQTPVTAKERDAHGCGGSDRFIRFETSEATIMNLDLSPDGRRLVFEMLGDIYMMPSTGGQAVPLTQGLAWDVRPVWSPDGSSIAFISDRSGADNVFVMSLEGDRKISQVSRWLDMSPEVNEGLILSAEWVPGSLDIVVDDYRINAITGEETKVRPSTRYRGQAYISNGAAVYEMDLAVEGKGHDRGLAIGGIGTEKMLRKIGGDVSVPEQIPLRIRSVTFEPPVISRNQRWLIYRERAQVDQADSGKAYFDDRVRVRDLFTGNDRILIGVDRSPEWQTDGEGAFPQNGRFAISADSRYLYAPYGGTIHRIEIESGNDQSLPLKATLERCLPPIVRNQVDVGGQELDVRSLRSASADSAGRRVVFSALRRLYEMDLPDGKPQPMVKQEMGQFEPVYSPDDKWIAYVSWDSLTGGHLWAVSTSGGEPVRLTQTPGYYRSPTWSPDGEKLAVVGNVDLSVDRSGKGIGPEAGQIFLVSFDDRTARALPVQARLGNPPAFSGDGETIWYSPFSETLSNQVMLRSMTLDGVSRRDINFDDVLPHRQIKKVIPSPNGHDFAVKTNGNLYLVRCDPAFAALGGRAADCQKRLLTNAGALDPRWRKGGAELEWTFADTYHHVSIASINASLHDEPSGAEKNIAATDGASSVKIMLEVPRRRGHGTLALTGARIITMRGDEVIEKGTVLIKDGKINRLGPTDDVRIPEGVTVIDVGGKTIMPGLIDVHAHISDLPGDLLVSSDYGLLSNLAHGVTTIREPSSRGERGYAYSDLIESGLMMGPRMYSAEALIFHQNDDFESFEDVVEVASRQRTLGGTFIKYHTGWNRLQRNWIVDAARRLGMNVAAHVPVANYSPGRLNLTTIDDGATTSEHAFAHGRHLFGDVATYLAKSGVAIDFSTLAGSGKYSNYFWEGIKDNERTRRFLRGSLGASSRNMVSKTWSGPGLPPLFGNAESDARFLTRFARAGGIVMIGAHGYYSGLGTHWEMWAHVRGGMTPHEVLRAGTITGAYGIGVEKDLGSIETGKIADLLILENNPLDDIRNTLSVERVMKDGILYGSTTLDEVWPERQSFPE